MGFNRRKLEDQRREAAEKEAASKRATDPKCLRMLNGSSPSGTSARPSECMLFSPTIGAAIAAQYWFLWIRCPHAEQSVQLTFAP